MALAQKIFIGAGTFLVAALCLTAQQLRLPAGSNAGMYALSRLSTGPTYVSWLEPNGDREYRLLFSKFQKNKGWTNPRVIATGSDWFINQSDRPTIEVLENGTLLAHWLVRHPEAKLKHGYGLKVAMSQDHGQNWKVIYSAGLSHVDDYTGFLSFLPEGKTFQLAYLAPPEKYIEGHIKTLLFARFSMAGEPLSDAIVDSDVCTCCPTAAVMTPQGPVVGYRDHRPNNMRDISILRKVQGKWKEPQAISEDRWQINGCPSDGPAMDSKEETLVVAFYTKARDVSQVKIVFSKDSGSHFSPAMRVDQGNPAGRVDVQLIDEENAIVSWVDKRSSGHQELFIRRISSSGWMSPIQKVGTAADGRASGFPAIRILGKQLLVVWKADYLISRLVEIPELSVLQSSVRTQP